MPTSRRGEFAAGIREQLPLLLGVTPFGLAYGAYAVKSGLPSGLALGMSAIVFGGASQFVGTRLIAEGTLGVVVVLTVALVNSRHLLYSASLAPYVQHLRRPWRWTLAYLLTDEAYAVAIARYRRGGDEEYSHWFFFGTAMALWVCWQVSTAAGIFVGAAVPDTWELDFALPVTFIALLVPMLSQRAAIVAALVAGAFAVTGFRWPYAMGLITAAVAGMAAGMLADRWFASSGDESAREVA